jgi:hypothetical protein
VHQLHADHYRISGKHLRNLYRCHLVTVTCSATCTTGWTGGGGAGATVVTIRGVTAPDYDGVFLVQTVTDGTHFTVNANIGAIAASSGGNVAQSPVALEIDTTGTTGGGLLFRLWPA